MNETRIAMTPSELAHLGGGTIAYVKAMRSEEVARLFPQAPAMKPGVLLFALLAADGSPIVLADTRDAALANAWENHLQTVSLH
jgi:hypothetical protein